MNNVELLMGDTTGNISLVGEKIRADGWWGSRDGSHSIQIITNNFKGRVGIQASLAPNPSDEDWFYINLNGNSEYITYDCPDSSSKIFNLTGNFVWIRALMDRANVPSEITPQSLSTLGSISKIILSR